MADKSGHRIVCSKCGGFEFEFVVQEGHASYYRCDGCKTWMAVTTGFDEKNHNIPTVTRVGAIAGGDEDNKVLDFFGYGTYMGYKNPTPEVIFMGQPHPGTPNPQIKLDSGDIVWGCECWWGKEEDVKERIEKYKEKGFTINTIAPAEYRERHKPKEEG